ncbi:poly [ADP-ribose] polymerase-like [Macrosteles quadrilineatus]|uniref:poly [ADP-ribose] polymerase-like n=1 Tax=Macrosteles quadrilineatus TaxID=74068 RepID=UPI0023E0F063|nr:poly [ADP-ribose] polymerase-like [Macrosteles quadrilineatus]
MSGHLPYRAEYAKSDRSSCQGCKQKIAKETLRLAVVVQSPSFDGVIPKWYHQICFFAKQRPKAVGDIEHFEALKWDDQEKIREKVTAIANGAGAAENGQTKGKKGKKRAGGAEGGAAKKMFQCDVSKSSRATCRGCHEIIMKGELRAAKMDYDSDDGRRYGGVPLWHHLDCFVKLRQDLGFFMSADQLDGFTSLKDEDKAKFKEVLPAIKAKPSDSVDGPPAPKKTKAEPVNEEEKKELKKQTDILYKYTKFLKSLSRSELVAIMNHNDEEPEDQHTNIERIADAMAFGWPVECEKCKNGPQIYRMADGGYRCKGNLTAWVACDNVTTEPKRKPFEIPSNDQLAEKFAELRYKPKLRKRIIRVEERTVNVNFGPSTSEQGPKIKSDRILPLKNMEFVIIGKSLKRDELKKEITKLGGKVVTKVHSKLAAVISTQEEVEKKNKRMEEVEEANIQVVPESFIQESLKGGAIENISRLNMASWGSDAKKRLEGIESLKSKSISKSAFSKSNKSSKVTLKVKGGSAVDPESGMEDVAHVYNNGKDIYSAVLSLTDMQSGVNKYYRIQVLESDKKTKYWVFRAWGRIGTSIGGTKLDTMGSLQEAINMFKEKFEDSTGNRWENRHNFVKVPHKMVPMDIDLGTDESDSVRLNTESSIESKLPKPVQDLISMIFNVDTMKKVMLEFELDLEKMPLGKISKRQIQQAYTVLSELQRALQNEDNKLIITDGTNRFYTLVPHDFGIKQPPPLDNLEIIKNKMEMLESLLEMEVAYSMLKSDPDKKEEGEHHPIDLHYHKLKAEIEPLPRDSEEFVILEKYVKNTHAATHTQYSLVIEEIFKVKRHVEERRFKPFKKLPNRKLLWHGSRLTNFAGILSQGLRIAPPEAPSTGYMFGKGIYFADMVSKSANYCMTSPVNNTGLMLLCEVALGNMYERTHAEYIENLPSGKHSCKGVGATCPDPSEKTELDGAEVPHGKPTQQATHKETSLLYNEYIVYDIGQVKARYLFRMKFDYKF